MIPFRGKIEKMIHRKVPSSVTPVYVEEEFGYRVWLWLPKLNWVKLENWWENLPRIDKFNMQKQFRQVGELIELCHSQDKLRNFMHFAFVFDDVDSYLFSPKWFSNKTIYHLFHDEANKILDKECED